MKQAPVPLVYYHCLQEEKEEEYDDEDTFDDDDACENVSMPNVLMPYKPHSCLSNCCSQVSQLGIGRVPASLLMRDGPKPTNSKKQERRMQA